jgi:hypothetical protein
MEPEQRDIQIPLDPSDSGSAFLPGKAVVLAEREGRGVAEIDELDEQAVGWLEEFDKVYFQVLGDGKTLKAVRKATDEDIKKYRVPIWIQDEEIPSCCGRPMNFVGQLDDNTLCTERPVDAKMWWHDAASFYVFTCSQCLSVQAVGQQF